MHVLRLCGKLLEAAACGQSAVAAEVLLVLLVVLLTLLLQHQLLLLQLQTACRCLHVAC
jgi:hypothetical protein